MAQGWQYHHTRQGYGEVHSRYNGTANKKDAEVSTRTNIQMDGERMAVQSYQTRLRRTSCRTQQHNSRIRRPISRQKVEQTISSRHFKVVPPHYLPSVRNEKMRTEKEEKGMVVPLYQTTLRRSVLQIQTHTSPSAATAQPRQKVEKTISSRHFALVSRNYLPSICNKTLHRGRTAEVWHDQPIEIDRRKQDAAHNGTAILSAARDQPKAKAWGNQAIKPRQGGAFAPPPPPRSLQELPTGRIAKENRYHHTRNIHRIQGAGNDSAAALVDLDIRRQSVEQTISSEQDKVLLWHNHRRHHHIRGEVWRRNRISTNLPGLINEIKLQTTTALRRSFTAMGRAGGKGRAVQLFKRRQNGAIPTPTTLPMRDGASEKDDAVQGPGERQAKSSVNMRQSYCTAAGATTFAT